jgi:hypothetical protein
MYYNTGVNATPDGEFTDGDPETGVARSLLQETWPNMMQREGLSLLARAGIAPDPDVFDQWTQAVEYLIAESRDTYIPIGFPYTQFPGTSPPATLYPGTTWTQVAAGQTLVGLLTGDPDFGALGADGGNKTHTLTASEMPEHDHNISNDSGGTNYGLVPTSLSGATVTPGSIDSGLSGSEPNVNVSPKLMSSVGGGAAHNNLQPFLVVVFWIRTA